MQKSLLVVFLMLFMQASQAQEINAPTPFDAFITKKKIIWAQGFNITFPQEQQWKNTTIAELTSGKIQLYKGITFRWPDAENIIPTNVEELKKSKTANPFPTNDTSFNSFTGYEILYVCSGKLYAYIPWLNVTGPVVTPAGTHLGRENIASFAVNKKHKKFKFRENEYVGTESFYVNLDSLVKSDKLKEFYGQNLADITWQQLKTGKAKAFDVVTGKEITRNAQGEFENPNEVVNVPEYDADGNPKGTKRVVGVFAPESFKRLKVTQRFFYDKRRHTAGAQIKEILFYVDFDLNYVKKDESGYTPVFRVEF